MDLPTTWVPGHIVWATATFDRSCRTDVPREAKASVAPIVAGRKIHCNNILANRECELQFQTKGKQAPVSEQASLNFGWGRFWKKKPSSCPKDPSLASRLVCPKWAQDSVSVRSCAPTLSANKRRLQQGYFSKYTQSRMHNPRIMRILDPWSKCNCPMRGSQMEQKHSGA